jgi:hypothetical protein
MNLKLYLRSNLFEKMKTLWCWRCRMDIPMLDEEEYKSIFELYTNAFEKRKSGLSFEESLKPMIAYYKELTGFDDSNPNSILHHRISRYGPPCENCNKPYRTHIASFCANCGNKRNSL